MIKERLQQYLKLKHLSIRGFEQLCGIGQSVLAKINDATSEETFRKIEENSDLNLEWLLNGTGNMIDPNRQMASNINDRGTQVNFPNSKTRDITITVKEDEPEPQAIQKSPIRKRQPSASELQKEIERLNAHIDRLEKELAKTQGKLEQQNEFIRMLIEKK